MTHKGNGDQMIDDLLDVEDMPEEPKRKRKNDEAPPLYIQARDVFKGAWESKEWGSGFKDDNAYKKTIRIATVWAALLIIIGVVWFIVTLAGWLVVIVILAVIMVTVVIASIVCI